MNSPESATEECYVKKLWQAIGLYVLLQMTNEHLLNMHGYYRISIKDT